MSMNNYPKQCTVTKLGRVHNAHTQGPGCAHSAVLQHALGHVALAQLRVVHAGSRVAASQHRVAVLQHRVVVPQHRVAAR